MKQGGIVLMVVGVLMAIVAFVYDPTVSSSSIYGGGSETYNIGLLQYQQLIFEAGLANFVAGAFFIAVGVLIQRLEDGEVIPRPVLEGAVPAQSKQRSCNWCGRTLPVGSVACTSLTHEQLSDVGPAVEDSVCQRHLSERGYRRPSAKVV